MDLSGGALFGGAAIGGLLVALWSRLRGILNRFISMFIVTVKVEHEMAPALSLYCWENLKRSPFGNRSYSTEREYVRPKKRRQIVGYESIGKDAVVFWKGWRPLFVGSKAGTDNENSSVSITYIRFMWSIDDLLIRSLDLYNQRADRGNRITRFRVERLYGRGSIRSRMGGEQSDGNQTIGGAVYEIQSSLTMGDKRILRWDPEEIGPDVAKDGGALQYLSFPDHIYTIIDELKHWLDSEKWYIEKRIPWRRGWLLFGVPGTGKTSVVRAIAEDFDLPVFVFDLATMSNKEFSRSWQRMESSSPCIALLEDIDGVFDGRRNILGDQGGGLTFDCLLNTLGGIEVPNGVFLVVTTNDISKVDDALGKPVNGEKNSISTRPGRIDRALELTIMSEGCRETLAQRIMNDCNEYIEEVVKIGLGYTPAQFQELCSQVALSEHWAKGAGAEVIKDHRHPAAKIDTNGSVKNKNRRIKTVINKQEATCLP